MEKIIFPASQKKHPRDGLGDALLELGRDNPDIVVLTADLAESTRVFDFSRQFPGRFFDVGVAEQNLIGLAAGLALGGKIPFVTSYAVFSPGRNWDQLRVSVCYSHANVKIIGSHAGITVGPDGATHQALEDLAITRVLPNLAVLAPADYEETKKAVRAAAVYPGPVYLRLSREATPAFTLSETPFNIGKANLLREGGDVTLIACGDMVYPALEVAEQLSSQNISCEVINLHTLKPIDPEVIVASAKKTGAVVTLEDHQITGGLYGAVAEVLSQNFPVPIQPVGIHDLFGESGKTEELIKKYGLSAESIKETIKKVLTRKEQK